MPFVAVRLLVGAVFIPATPSMVGSAVVSGPGWVLLVTTGVMLFISWGHTMPLLSKLFLRLWPTCP